jgi:hypothetical protein
MVSQELLHDQHGDQRRLDSRMAGACMLQVALTVGNPAIGLVSLGDHSHHTNPGVHDALDLHVAVLRCLVELQGRWAVHRLELMPRLDMQRTNLLKSHRQELVRQRFAQSVLVELSGTAGGTSQQARGLR